MIKEEINADLYTLHIRILIFKGKSFEYNHRRLVGGRGRGVPPAQVKIYGKYISHQVFVPIFSNLPPPPVKSVHQAPMSTITVSLQSARVKKQ